MQLRDYQQEALQRIHESYDVGTRRQLLVLPTGTGKCLGKGTPVLMFDGTVQAVENVRPGDLLMGPDSRPRTVLSTARGRGPLYRIVPIKGDSYVVNDAHILSLVITGNRPVSGHRAGSVVNLSVTEWLNRTREFKHCAKGWRASVEWAARPVQIDPYWLGLWLGDGNARNTQIYKPDQEVADYVQEYAARLGLEYVRLEPDGKCPGHAISSQKGPYQNPLKNALREYGLLENKHIPLAYRANARDVRMALLAGIIDSDGSRSSNGIDYVSVSEVLARDVAFLARSLGLAAYVKPCKKTCGNNGKVGDYFRVSISGDLSQCPIRIPRKRCAPRLQKKDVLRTGIQVVPEGEGEYYGFEIDGDRLFLLGDFTVTHNTVLFSAAIESWPGRALVLAHRDRLIQQAFEKISQQIPLNNLGIVKAEQNRHYAQCVVASVQTLARAGRLAKMPTFDLVVIDEAHRSAAKTYGRILDQVCHSRTLLLGVTATPDRSDGIGLDKVYDEIVYEMGLLDAIERGYLVDLRAIQIQLPIDLSGVHTKKNSEGINDYALNEVASLMDASNWVECVTKGWRENAADRRTIAFVPRVRQAYALAEYMRSQGIVAAAVDGSMSTASQRAIVQQFEEGFIQVLINCDLFTEGADIPSINCVMMCSPTKSRTVYSQRVGRGTRLSPATGKTDCLILDMVGVTNRLDLCTAASLIGAARVERGESLREAKKREDREAEQLELELQKFEGELQRTEVDLFNRERERRRSGLFEWQIDRAARQAVMMVRGHRYEIWRPDERSPYRFADMATFGGLEGQAATWQEAQAIVERAAKEALFGDKDAPWRRKDATPKQIELMTKHRIPFREGITNGEASDLLQPLFDRWERAKQRKTDGQKTQAA